MGLFNSKNRGDDSPQDSKRNQAADDREKAASKTGTDASAWTTRSVGERGDGASGSSSSTSNSASGSAQAAATSAPASGKTPAANQTGRGDTRPANRERTERSTSSTRTSGQGNENMASMGQSIVFKGELTGDEDLEIEGNVDGRVTLANHQLTVGSNGRVTAEIEAKSIVVIGQVTGNLTASERIEVQATGVVNGDLRAPRLNVQEGAILNGSIEMTSAGAPAGKKPAASSSSSTGTSASGSTASAPPPSA